ncbi:hypothetical protein BSM4216_2028 [Bacillus smithii]|nr:hypothetical protein BSM4216_2028 [Bacillus smithii]
MGSEQLQRISLRIYNQNDFGTYKRIGETDNGSADGNISVLI